MLQEEVDRGLNLPTDLTRSYRQEQQQQHPRRHLLASSCKRARQRMRVR
jgi:hypothetical protein